MKRAVGGDSPRKRLHDRFVRHRRCALERGDEKLRMANLSGDVAANRERNDRRPVRMRRRVANSLRAAIELPQVSVLLAQRAYLSHRKPSKCGRVSTPSVAWLARRPSKSR